MNLLDEIGELHQTLNVERRRNDLEKEFAERQQLSQAHQRLEWERGQLSEERRVFEQEKQQ